MSFKTIICDDFKDARYIIKEYIKKLGINQIEIIDEASDGEELIEKCKLTVPDIVILDVDMPNINGIDAAKYLIKIYPNISFVFITGYSDFAIEAFDVYAVDYIVKPINIERFEKTLKHIINTKSMKENANKFITLTYNYQKYIIEQNSILFIEREKRKTLVHTNTEVIELYESIDSIQERLNNNMFLRTHRNCLVNIKTSYKISKTFGRTYEIIIEGYEKRALLSRSNLKYFSKLK